MYPSSGDKASRPLQHRAGPDRIGREDSKHAGQAGLISNKAALPGAILDCVTSTTKTVRLERLELWKYPVHSPFNSNSSLASAEATASGALWAQLT